LIRTNHRRHNRSAWIGGRPPRNACELSVLDAGGDDAIATDKKGNHVRDTRTAETASVALL